MITVNWAKRVAKLVCDNCHMEIGVRVKRGLHKSGVLDAVKSFGWALRGNGPGLCDCPMCYQLRLRGESDTRVFDSATGTYV